jgi:hypothetical protein
MSVITFEGFENYSTFNDVALANNMEAYQVPSLMSSADGITTPRNNQSCLKMLNSSNTSLVVVNTGRYFDNPSGASTRYYYPKIIIKTANALSYNNSIIGFAYYSYLPSGAGYGPFTPIAAVVGADNKPHFYICINANRQVEIRRWNTSATMTSRAGAVTAANYVWNQDPIGFNRSAGEYCQSTLTSYDHHISTSTSTAWGICGDGTPGTYPQNPIDPNKFTLVGTSDIGKNLIQQNQWNYIELKFVLENTNSNTGSLSLKINRNMSDNTLDMNLSSIQNSTQNNKLTDRIMFGTVWGHNSAGTAGAGDLSWPTYIDDIYWLVNDSVGLTDYLGRINIARVNYDTVVSNTMTPSGVAGLSTITDTYGGVNSYNLPSAASGTLRSYNINETLDVRATGVSYSNTPIAVQQFLFGHRENNTCTISFSSTLNASSSTPIPISGMTTDSVNGKGYFVSYTGAPDGSSWTIEKIKNTTFKHTISNI